jgi:hypothetical protein
MEAGNELGERREVSDLQELIEQLGEAAGQCIYDWQQQINTKLILLECLTNGFTDAKVAVAMERPATGHPRKLVLKVCPPEDGTDRAHEPSRHAQALQYAPDFADEHLVDMLHEPLHVGDGVWVTFQALAGYSLRDTPPLSALLQGVANSGDGPEPPCTADELASVCGMIVRSLLDDWPAQCSSSAGPVGVGSFLEQQLRGRHQPSGSLHRWAKSHLPELLDGSSHRIELGSEVLLNPMALVGDRGLARDRSVVALTGPTHGDLQPQNILVPVRNIPRGADVLRKLSTYWLIDLSGFEPDAPLSFDPVHLLLSIVKHQLGRMADREQDALLRFIIDSDDESSGALLPTWLNLVVSSIVRATPGWIEPFMSEWREQMLLSTVACGLIFTGRSTTADALRRWFLRLAAHAGEAYMRHAEGHTANRPTVRPVVDASEADDPAAGQHTGPRGVSPAPTRSAPAETAGPPAVSADAEPSLVKDGRHRLKPDLVRASDELADRVWKQWTDEAAERRLVTPDPIRVRWERASNPVVGRIADAVGETPASRGEAPEVVLRRGDVSDLFAAYCTLRPGRGRLIIMGDEGAGKRTAAIRLLLDVLEYRSGIEDPADRTAIAVPVILTPHDWDPKRQTAASWLAQRVSTDCLLLGSRWRGRRAAKKLIREGRVALFLDGLDDMPERLRYLALRELDRQTSFRVVLLSRTTEMVTAASDAHLSSAMVIELRPVEPDEAANYLVRSQVEPLPPSWARLVDHIRQQPDSPVTQALDSPRMLGLVLDNYSGAGQVDELLDTSRFPHREAVEHHLLGRVQPAAYELQSRTSTRSYSLDQVQRWLGFLARLLRRDNTL